MTDETDPEPETVPTTAYLPDHLVGGGTATLPTVRTIEDDPEGDADESNGDEADAGAADGPANATAEVCRSWRRQRSASRSRLF